MSEFSEHFRSVFSIYSVFGAISEIRSSFASLEGRCRKARRDGRESRREWTAKIVRRVDIRTGGRGRRVRREESQEGGEQEGERGRRAGGRRAGWRGWGELRRAGGRMKALSYNGLQVHGSQTNIF